MSWQDLKKMINLFDLYRSKMTYINEVNMEIK